MPALGPNSERVGNTKKKGAEAVPRHALAVREAMRVICRARRWQVDCKLAWLCLFVEAWVGSSAGLLSNWQRAGPKSLASFRRGSIPVRMPWDISPSGSGAPEMVQRRYRGVRLLRTKRCCEIRSASQAKSLHAGLARSEQVWLLRLGSAPLQGCSTRGRRQDQHV